MDIVLAEMGLERVGRLVQGEDVVCRLQLGDSYEADL